MTTANLPTKHTVLVESEVEFTLAEFSRACRADIEHLVVLVYEGILNPHGSRPEQWRFEGRELKRARMALRISRDLEVNAAGTAMLLDLLDEISHLRARLGERGRLS